MRISVIKSKIIYCLAVFLAVILGLGTRAFGDHLPYFISEHFGDAIWAGMIYLAFRVLLTRHPLWMALVLSLCFSFGIEFSQLYQAEWIVHVRATTPGGLILGQGFLWIDLVRYMAGALFCYVLDSLLQN